jgi:hypothetical protein
MNRRDEMLSGASDDAVEIIIENKAAMTRFLAAFTYVLHVLISL